MQDSLFKQYKGVFDEKGEEVIEKKPREYEYSPFALQDAIGAKDAKSSWIEYLKLRTAGVEAEAIAPNVISKARDMLAIVRGASQADLQIKSPFPYNKSKKDAKNWKETELENFYTKLVAIYHESRMGGEDMEIALEKALLCLQGER
jgi:DNA polymerase III delta subunit